MLHKCKSKTQTVLIWSKNQLLVEKTLGYLQAEFEESFTLITLADLSILTEKYKIDELEKIIEKFDFHVIKVFPSNIVIIFKDNTRNKHTLNSKERSDFEEILDKVGREIIYWNFEKSKNNLLDLDIRPPRSF